MITVKTKQILSTELKYALYTFNPTDPTCCISLRHSACCVNASSDLNTSSSSCKIQESTKYKFN